MVNSAHITTNLGALLGTTDSGIGISWNTGLNEWGYANVAKIDAYNWTGLDALGLTKVTSTGTKLTFNLMGMANVHAAVALDGGIDVGVGTAVYEIVYVNKNADEQELGIAAGLKGAELADRLVLGVTTSWLFDLEDDAEPEWAFNAGVNAKYDGLVSGDVVLVGDEDSSAQVLGIGIGLTPVEFATLQFGVGIGLDDEIFEDAFNSFDGSVNFLLGRVNARFGYYWLAEDAPVGIVKAEYARSNLFSGIYARVRVQF